ncbi:unnamed protein product [Ilex paraguariensis]|uniref:MADS-box domain-containing protein n=1 Tax=Ilex paraguariensis TaxID=185542 RepID=A0ABC8T5G6_9AQUA
MVRSMVKYELIANENARRETFRKRKAGLLKKASELKTLCNIDACAIIYNKDGGPPDVWPSSVEAHRLLHRFNNLPIMVKTSTMMDQEGFLIRNLERLNKNLEKEKKTRQLEMEQLLARCLVENNAPDVSNSEYMKDFLYLVDDKFLSIRNKISVIKHSGFTPDAVGNKAKNELESSREKESF